MINDCSYGHLFNRGSKDYWHKKQKGSTITQSTSTCTWIRESIASAKTRTAMISGVIEKPCISWIRTTRNF